MELDPLKCQGVIAPEGTTLMFQCNMPPALRTPKGFYCYHHQPKGTARMSTTAIATEIMDERLRQTAVEGWTPDSDDKRYSGTAMGELSQAAAAYCMHARADAVPHLAMSKLAADAGKELWPWGAIDYNPKDARRDLIRAGALIIAEIERIDRAAVVS